MSHTGRPGDKPRLLMTGFTVLYDRRGYPRSVVTLPSYRLGTKPGNAGKKLPAEVLTTAEAYRLLDAAGDSSFGLRNQSLIATMWRGGLRIAEALALEPKDIDWERGWITVLNGKGSKRRVAPIDPEGLEYLERWRVRRRELGFTTGPLHCVLYGPTKGERLGSPQVRGFMKQYAEKAGIERNVRPHGLRHSFAVFHNEAGTPVTHIQRALGHSSLAITAQYLDHLNPARVLEDMTAVRWPKRPTA